MAERTLVVLRHAKTEDGVGRRDADRALTGRGRRDAVVAGERLPVRPDVVICSPAVRARQTWDEVRAAAGLAIEALLEPAVYEATVDDLLDVLVALPADKNTALVVGHNPACEDLVAALTGDHQPMPTCSLAVLRWTGGWVDVRGASVELVARATSRA